MLGTILGLVVGGAAGYAFGLLRSRRGAEDDASAIADLAGAQAALDEVRKQITAKDAELTALRQALENEKVSGADARARLESARDHFAEQRRQIAEMETKVKETFGALSAEALKGNNEQFITLADAKLKPLREQLERYEKNIVELEKTRAEAYGGLNKQLESLSQSELRITHETGQLVAALRQSGTKGKWGEVTLQRIVELSGLTQHCDFDTQASQDSGQRPDLIVKLPGDRTLAIDAKVNTSAYLDAAGATNEEDRKRHLDRFIAAVRTTIKNLSAKEYWRQFSPAPEFVVMFMPGEAFFSTAVSLDPDLLYNSADSRVILASPTTLMALLMAIRHGWQQQQVAENAERIAEAGRELYDRLCVFAKHIDGVRGGLQKAAEAYNNAVGNWESRTLPSAKKLKELGAADAGTEVTELQSLETQLRVVPTEFRLANGE
ncbi:MAG: DNA recombination protein RmuC [Planctomycetota bacterium]